MNANRILMFWMYYIISIFVVVCLAFILKKVKIVRWQFFYPGQQEWAKRNEEKIDKLCKRFLLLICIIYSLLIIVPSTLDLPYVLSKNYKTVQGVVSEKKGMFICVKSTHNRRERPVHGHRGRSRGPFYYRITTFGEGPWDARDPHKTTFMTLK